MTCLFRDDYPPNQWTSGERLQHKGCNMPTGAQIDMLPSASLLLDACLVACFGEHAVQCSTVWCEPRMPGAWRDLAYEDGLIRRPSDHICPVYWEVPMSTAKLQRILRFRMGSHLLTIEQGRHLRLPRHRRVCRLCHIGALGDERHMLLECPALADLRDEFSPLIAECSGVMARLVWARNQPMVSRYIIACLDRMSC